jgi:carboxylesterase type B
MDLFKYSTRGYISGYVYDSFVPFLFVSFNGRFPDLEKDFDNVSTNWESLAPILLDFNDTLAPSLWKDAAQKIRQFYLGKDQKSFEQIKDKVIKMFSDRIFLVDAETSARMQAKASSSPVYYYYFSYPGDNNEAKSNIELTILHCD